MKKIIGFIGSPGSGKSTQAGYLAEHLGKMGKEVQYINVGQILRDSKDKEVIAIMNSGELVDDNIVFKVLDKQLRRLRGGTVVVLDGFFRRDTEALWLLEKSNELGVELDQLVDLRLSNREATMRLSQRGRGDDELKDIRVRLKVFARERRGILKVLWRAKIKVIPVRGKGTREEVFERVRKKVKLK